MKRSITDSLSYTMKKMQYYIELGRKVEKEANIERVNRKFSRGLAVELNQMYGYLRKSYGNDEFAKVFPTFTSLLNELNDNYFSEK